MSSLPFALRYLVDIDPATDVLPEIAPESLIEGVGGPSSTPFGVASVEPEPVMEQGEADAFPDVNPIPIESQREAVEGNSAFSGYVVDADGEPIEGAIVSWTPIPDELMSPYSTYLSLREFVADESQETRSDTKGAFAFEAKPELLTENGSVVWITHTRFAPRFLLLGSKSDSWTRWSRYEFGFSRPGVCDCDRCRWSGRERRDCPSVCNFRGKRRRNRKRR